MPPEPYWNVEAQKIRTRNELVVQYLPLVTHIAKLIWNKKIARRIGEFDDLVSSGYEALIRSAELYNPGHDSTASFKTYCYRSVLRAILRAADEAGIIRVPASTLRAVRAPSVKTKPQTPEVCRSVNAAISVVSLPEDYDIFGDHDNDHTLWVEDVHRMVDGLPEEIRDAIRASFGIDCESKSLAKIGKDQGVTGQSVRQRRNQGLDMLRQSISRE